MVQHPVKRRRAVNRVDWLRELQYLDAGLQERHAVAVSRRQIDSGISQHIGGLTDGDDVSERKQLE
jgi:hypothetical protein